MLKKIRFFGDSWFWNWYYPDMKSTAIKKVLLEQGFPAIAAYLKYLDIEPICHNLPGRNFEQTVIDVLSTENHDDIKYNVIFIASIFRRNHHRLDVTNYTNFIKAWDAILISRLTELQNWAQKNNQQILLLGGQTTLHKNLFEQVENRKNLHLVAECIISKLTNRFNTHGFLKLATDVTDYVDTTWHPELVEHMHNDITAFENDNDKFLFTLPDRGHLNPHGSLLVLDMILSEIEQIEKSQIG